MTDASYRELLNRKTHLGSADGFLPSRELPGFLFPFQRDLVLYALQQGRAALFADCGMGKTAMQLVWADHVARHTNRPVLIVAPLAVASQTMAEGAKFGLEVRRSNDGRAFAGLTITNYERLHHFNAADFAGAVCDESSAIKSFEGSHRALVTAFMRKLRYRLLCTATAAPNDYIELGTSSEALGYLGYTDMLQRFFKNDQGNSVKTNRRWAGSAWRFKGHAEDHFWRYVASWARALRRPSDLGYSDEGFLLPALREREHLVKASRLAEGMLFELPPSGLAEEREESRRTLAERCDRVAQLVNGTGRPAVVWCHLNDEGHRLQRLIPDAVQVSGADELDDKERKLMAFTNGEERVLITKPKIGAWGLNWQHCSHMTFFPSHSYESYYQAVRRCWRYGQPREVTVDIVTTEGGHDVMANLQRKADQSARMFDALVRHMRDGMRIVHNDGFTSTLQVPAWL